MVTGSGCGYHSRNNFNVDFLINSFIVCLEIKMNVYIFTV